ncbi:TetR/AcrR family transcriptional regulator [Rhodococcus erythropolis]
MTSTPQRPGGRSARVREAVLAATAAELSERGFAAMSIEDIAARSGVHKTTIYRRWSTLSQLVADAAVEVSATTVPIPDTGSIESDLREMARSIVALVTSESGGALVAALFSDAVRTPEVARLKREFYSARYELADIVVRRAVERGEISEKVSLLIFWRPSPRPSTIACWSPIYLSTSRLPIALLPARSLRRTPEHSIRPNEPVNSALPRLPR